MADNKMIIAAKNLSEIVDRLDRSQALLQEAYTILHPILCRAISGNLTTPGGLPNRSFFFGMHEHSLPSHYLDNVEFMNALGAFDEAWRREGKAER